MKGTLSLGLGLGLELIYATLVGFADTRIDASIGLLLVATCVYAVACQRRALVSRRIVLGFALLHRATAWGESPQLSDDLQRYRWEARIQQAGANPYLARPSDPEWAGLRDVDRIPAPDAPAGYGPLQTGIQSVSFRLAQLAASTPAGQAIWMKLPAIVGDLAILAMLAGQPWLIVYAWCPATVLEFGWSGHNDGLVLAFVVAAWRWRSHAALGAAIALKWWPVLLIPALWRARPSWRMLAIPAILIAAAIPYVPPDWRDILTNARYMSGYVGGWRNNDSLYSLTLWLAGGREYPAKYASFAMLAAVTLWTAWRWPLERAWLGTIVATLLLSANCHPWYLTWMVPMMAIIGPWPPLILWIGLMPLAYQNLISWWILGEWRGSTPERWWIFGPVLAMMAVYTGKSALETRWTRARSS